MITIKSASELVKMQAAGRIVGETLKLLGENVRPGVTTAHLDKLAHARLMLGRGCRAAIRRASSTDSTADFTGLGSYCSR